MTKKNGRNIRKRRRWRFIKEITMLTRKGEEYDDEEEEYEEEKEVYKGDDNDEKEGEEYDKEQE